VRQGGRTRPLSNIIAVERGVRRERKEPFSPSRPSLWPGEDRRVEPL